MPLKWTPIHSKMHVYAIQPDIYLVCTCPRSFHILHKFSSVMREMNTDISCTKYVTSIAQNATWYTVYLKNAWRVIILSLHSFIYTVQHIYIYIQLVLLTEPPETSLVYISITGGQKWTVHRLVLRQPLHCLSKLPSTALLKRIPTYCNIWVISIEVGLVWLSSWNLRLSPPLSRTLHWYHARAIAMLLDSVNSAENVWISCVILNEVTAPVNHLFSSPIAAFHVREY